MPELSPMPSLEAWLAIHQPQAVCEPPDIEIPPKDAGIEPRDEYLAASVSVWTVLTAAGAAIGKAVLSKVASRTVEKGEQEIRDLFPQPMTPSEQLMFETLYDAKSFSDGVEMLRQRWPEMTPLEILEKAFEFPYRFNPKNPLAMINDCSPNIITPEDIKTIMSRYSLTAMQVLDRAEVAYRTAGRGNNGIWSAVFSAIFTANREAASGSHQAVSLDKKMTESQEMFLKQLKHERMNLELETVGQILREIVGAIERTPAEAGGGADKVTLGGRYEIDVSHEVVGKKMGRFALAKMIEEIAERIEDGRLLTAEEEGIVERLKEKNPILQKIIDARTHHADSAIRGTNLALEMLKKVQSGKNSAWFGQILMEVGGTSKPVSAGVTVIGEDAANTLRYEFNYNSSGFKKGESIELYVEGDPHPIPPYSLRDGKVFVVKEGKVTIENAVQIIDGRGRSIFITTGDMEHFKSLAREIAANQHLKKSEIGRAYLRFFNRLQAMAVTVFGQDYVIEPGSPVQKIRQLAANLAKENWAAELETALNGVSREFANVEAVAARVKDGHGAGTLHEFIEGTLEAQMKALKSGYIKLFAPKLRQPFKNTLQRFEKAVLEGDVQARNLAMEEVRLLLAQQIVTRHADSLSLDLYTELREWLKVDSIEKYAKAKSLPDGLRSVIIARGVDKSIPPSLQKAREYAKDGSYERALLEYERLAAEKGTPVEVKIIALAEEAALAARKFQFPRARRAKARIEWFKATGVAIPKEAQELIDALPPLNHGERVVISPKGKGHKKGGVKEAKGPANEKGTEAHSADKVTGTTAPQNDIIDPDIFRPAIVGKVKKAGHAVKNFTYDIGGPAIVGAMTFLTAGEAVKIILPAPTTHLEGVIYGYDVVGTAILMDHGLQGMLKRLVHAGETAAKTAPFGLKSLFGGLGSAFAIYRGIEGAAKGAGMPQKASEVTGLVGTGIAYGAWRPVVNKIFSAETAARIISSAENMLTKGGLLYFISDAVPTVAEAVYNEFDDAISVMAREEWYHAMKAYHKKRGILGDAEGVPWYERAGNSVFNIADTFVPAAWHKGLAWLDGDAERWIDWCEARLKSGEACR